MFIKEKKTVFEVEDELPPHPLLFIVNLKLLIGFSLN